MGFTLLHAGLAAGAALAAIPIVLHLMLRQKPRHELFPALRLIRMRHRANLRKLRLRHWLLLAARMLLIALMALALARPSIHGATFIPDQQAPVAAAFVFDTSLSMEYSERDRTRLRDAQDIAIEILKEFPEGSEIAVLDAAEPTAQLYPDAGLATQRVESLRVRPRGRSVNQAILEACHALGQSDRTRKEIYLFSDLMAGSIDLTQSAPLQSALQGVPGGVAVYLLDVGISDVQNAFLAKAQPSAELIPANSDLRIEAVVQDGGQGCDVIAELRFDDLERGSRPLHLDKGKADRVDFLLPKLAPGVHQGVVSLRNGGNLSLDDQRYVTVEVQPVTRVLLVSDVERDAVNLRDALAPPLFVEQKRSRYDCDWIATGRFSGKRLADYPVVCLVNVHGLSATAWRALETFAMSGGGLGIFLGDRVDIANYNQEAAQAVVPVRLTRRVTPAKPVFLEAGAATHPALEKLRRWDPEAALARLFAEQYVAVEPGENSRRILSFSDGSVALAERLFEGTRPGRVIVCTTSVSTDPKGRSWNNLPQSPIEFVMLSDGMAYYLAGYAEQRLSYQSGEDVVLRPNRDQRFGAYLLDTPDADQPTRRSADPSDGSLVVSSVEALGNYRVHAGEGEQAFEKGFSVNPDPAESRLERLSPAELSAGFGDVSYAIAHTTQELRAVMGDLRIGRELFPWLAPVIVLLFALEHLLANRFYKKADGTEPRAQRRSAMQPVTAGRDAALFEMIGGSER
jgi:hypothetical protein